MPGFGGPGERLHRTEGVDSFWVWGKLAAVIEPKSPSSRPGKPGHASLWEAKALSSFLGTQATLSTHRADLAGLSQSRPTDPCAERGEELQPGADLG